MNSQITKISAALDQLIGKSYKYKGKIITIERYKVVGSTNIVVFTPIAFNFYLSEAEEFIIELGTELTPMEKSIFPSTFNDSANAPSNAVSTNNSQLRMIEPSKDVLTLKDALLDIVRKVSEDKEFVPQAKVICEAVNSFVALQKNEIDMNRLINKFK